ncbi:MAG: PRC-barrel domain containing protein [Candidatus Nitrohelix vancouverensis]|uniref:PRC-barrel domain containing protein n=1 Tax=Candidatus Nitrohelix vancouverensis TaxID=2705534 RepID=A0A7T0C052_9BACT|nr:MAG: PRC-barrel domain containing protein [Candidatus Nitrohelix vancouverensis]
MSQFISIKDNQPTLGKHNQIIGAYLYDSRGESVGKIESLLLDAQTRKPQFLTLQLGGFLRTAGKHILIPFELCEPQDLGKVVIQRSHHSLADAPATENPDAPSALEIELSLEYFDRATPAG